LLLSAYSLTPPRCPTNRAAESKSWVSVLGLDALVLFRQRRMALFFLFAMLLGEALQMTNTFGNPFLHDLSLNPLYQNSLSVRYPA
ncbi:MFS transporter, partial [Paenibacillus polymyxa]|nr:MFS transporter [Paenibacillus polymyxa]